MHITFFGYSRFNEIIRILDVVHVLCVGPCEVQYFTLTGIFNKHIQLPTKTCVSKSFFKQMCLENFLSSS